MARLLKLQRLSALVNADTVARLERMLIVAELIAGIDADTETELVERIAEILDDAIDADWALSQVLGAPAAGLVELVDRGVYRLMARRIVRVFRRRWGRLSATARTQILNELQQINGANDG